MDFESVFTFLIILIVILVIVAIPLTLLGMKQVDEEKKRKHELEVAKLNHERSVAEHALIKEIVMVPCQYCGALMPQTATFCNECGAKREA